MEGKGSGFRHGGREKEECFGARTREEPVE